MIVFLSTSVMADTLSQSDFYGTWNFNTSNETLVSIIAHDTWTIKINNEEPMTVKILRWENIDNYSIRTFQLFPNRFRITIEQLNGKIANTILYIDREKRRIIMPDFSGNEMLIKQ